MNGVNKEWKQRAAGAEDDGLCHRLGCKTPRPAVPSTTHHPALCDPCGFEDERDDLRRRFPVIENVEPEVLVVNLAREGKAIATILEALHGLEDHSIPRVLDAVVRLVNDTGPITHSDYRSERVKRAEKFFGTEDKDLDEEPSAP